MNQVSNVQKQYEEYKEYLANHNFEPLGIIPLRIIPIHANIPLEKGTYYQFKKESLVVFYNSESNIYTGVVVTYLNRELVHFRVAEDNDMEKIKPLL
jgi:uncharacterized membrane protein (DUF106 family)